MSLPQGTWFPVDRRPITKVATRRIVSNILGMYIFLTVGMMGQIWIITKAEEHSVILKPFIWGMAYACGMFVSGGYSGGSFHPGVTMAYAYLSKFQLGLLQTVGMILCDISAAFLAAASVVFLAYYEIQVRFGPGFQTDGNAREFYVQEFNSDSQLVEVILDAALSSFFYAFILAGLTDQRNHNIDRCWQPLYTAINVIVVGLAFGYVHGSTFNPYIDLVPRLACSLGGFSHCWTPWYNVVLTLFFTTLFAFLGVLAYKMLLEDRIKDRDHLVPHFGGRHQPKKANIYRSTTTNGNEHPYLVNQKRENFQYLLDAEDDIDLRMMVGRNKNPRRVNRLH